MSQVPFLLNFQINIGALSIYKVYSVLLCTINRIKNGNNKKHIEAAQCKGVLGLWYKMIIQISMVHNVKITKAVIHRFAKNCVRSIYDFFSLSNFCS